MEKSKYSERTVISDLYKKSGIEIKGFLIKVFKFNNLGNKSFGKLDFLQNYCGYKIIYL